jgi:Raf kinase inhibitor-like YbhB/YbcL family protein
MAFTLASDAFKPAGRIPTIYTCDGRDISPALSWSGPPPAAKSFAVICDDPDAPVGIWVHWVIFNIPASSHGLAQGVRTVSALEDGTRQGRNDFGRLGYGGPCPPQGKPHRYVFTLHALDRELALPAGALKADLVKAMEGRVLAKASLYGTYQR